MKIVLRAFAGKLSGVMEVPEETGTRFRLALTQPIQVSMERQPMMGAPLNTICEFEWTGGIYSQNGHEWDGAREYQLVEINKKS